MDISTGTNYFNWKHSGSRIYRVPVTTVRREVLREPGAYSRPEQSRNGGTIEPWKPCCTPILYARTCLIVTIRIRRDHPMLFTSAHPFTTAGHNRRN